MRYIAKTLYGLENVLAAELEELGASEIKLANRAVIFYGDRELLYKVNYCSRIALSVLMPLSDFRILSKEDLSRRASTIKWTSLFSVDDTFAVVPVVNSKIFAHSGYAGLVLKDAIADYFRNKTGRRPTVNTNDPDILINLHISGNDVTISLDSSVAPLYKRSYREEQGAAPLNEVLAAGIIKLSGWDAKSSLTDPMCGSGTIPVEAALMACNIAPGRFRKYYGFMRWKDYDKELFDAIKSECERMISKPDVKIKGSDVSQAAIDQAMVNITVAGLRDMVSLDVVDFKDTKSTDENGYVFMNPPYGQRLQLSEIDTLYSMIGSTLKHSYPGNTACIITSAKEYIKNIGLKPKEKYLLFNGPLECMFLKYELFAGTRKAWKNPKLK